MVSKETYAKGLRCRGICCLCAEQKGCYQYEMLPIEQKQKYAAPTQPDRDFRELSDFIERLRKEIKKYGKLTIAVDFDDTLCAYDPENIVPTKDREENVDICNLVRAIGDKAHFILWTCRSGNELDDAIDWTIEHNIPINSIGTNPFIDYGGKKIHANIFLDDRAGLKQAYEALKILYREEHESGI